MDLDFLDDITHKMKVTLTYVQGFATMLPLGGKLNTEQSRYVDKILKGTEQLADLVKDIETRFGLDEREG